MDIDHSYKLLFSHPRMVRDLLEAFIAEEWIDDVDFSTLARVSGDYVADNLRARRGDIVWRVRCGEHMVYLLVEFQSSTDRFMALRVLTYVGLLYQDLIKDSQSRDIEYLPAILPIVLHSGRKPWSAAEEMSLLVGDAPRGFEQYRPRLRYLLIDQARYDDAELATRRNLAAMLFRIESCRRYELMPQLLSTLLEWLQGPELDSLRRAFAVWLGKVVVKRLPRGEAVIGHELWEKTAMLSEQFDVWEREFLDKGRCEGRQEGRQEGLHDLLARLLRKRFGDLPQPVCRRLRSASLEELECWSDRLLDAASLRDVLDCVKPSSTTG